MDLATLATTLVVTGSVVFLVGASIAVPRVFTEPEPANRLAMLEAGRSRWRAGQPLYACGPLMVSVGVGVLAASSASSAGEAWLAASCVLLLIGASSWSVLVYQRARHVRAFALGELAWWPFAAYIWLTLAGLVALGVGSFVVGLPGWAGGLTLAGAVGLAIAFVRFGDIPPFVFHLLLPIVSLGWL